MFHPDVSGLFIHLDVNFNVKEALYSCSKKQIFLQILKLKAQYLLNVNRLKV